MFKVTIENVMAEKVFQSSGIFNTPVGASENDTVKEIRMVSDRFIYPAVCNNIMVTIENDSVSFSIYEKVWVHTPVIFTTAYDQYAIDLFQVNSIDYLLKPMDIDKLPRVLKSINLSSGIGILAKWNLDRYSQPL